MVTLTSPNSVFAKSGMDECSNQTSQIRETLGDRTRLVAPATCSGDAYIQRLYPWSTRAFDTVLPSVGQGVDYG
jgi:hypothetical protein